MYAQDSNKLVCGTRVGLGITGCRARGALRHTFASLMIAAGVNAKALSTYLGHSSIQIPLDRYGHLMPGNEQEAARFLDRYLRTGADLS